MTMAMLHALLLLHHDTRMSHAGNVLPRRHSNVTKLTGSWDRFALGRGRCADFG
jgi:hypothetical protein